MCDKVRERRERGEGEEGANRGEIIREREDRGTGEGESKREMGRESKRGRLIK